MESDLEEGEIIEEGEEASRGNDKGGPPNAHKNRMLRANTGRKTRKKYFERHLPAGGGGGGEKQRRRINGMSASVSQDLHRTRLKRNVGKRHVEALPQQQVASRTNLVIKVNNRGTRSTKGNCDTEGNSKRRHEPTGVKFRVKSSSRITRNHIADNYPGGPQNVTAPRRSILSDSSDDDAASIVSIPVPPKTPPELIVLDDSDNDNDEDVEVLQLRKAALEGLMAKLGREAAQSAPPPESREDDVPYSPPDDDVGTSANSENVLPERGFFNGLQDISSPDHETADFPTLFQPPASFLPLREPNGLSNAKAFEKSCQEVPVVSSSSSSSQNFFPASSSYTVTTPSSLFPQLGSGDVDMRLLNYSSNVPPTVSQSSFMPPNVPTVSQPNIVQYPLYHTHNRHSHPHPCDSTGHLPGPVMPPSLPYGFRDPMHPNAPVTGFSTLNGFMDPTRPWSQFSVQPSVTPFGFPCPVPSPNIVLPIPNYPSAAGDHGMITRIARPSVFADLAKPAAQPVKPVNAIPPEELFKNDIDHRASMTQVPERMSISPPASPPPEDQGQSIIQPPQPSPEERRSPITKQLEPTLDQAISVVTTEMQPSPIVSAEESPLRTPSPKEKERKPRSRSKRSRNRRSRDRRRESTGSRTRRRLSGGRRSHKRQSRRHSLSPPRRRHSEHHSPAREVELPEESANAERKETSSVENTAVEDIVISVRNDQHESNIEKPVEDIVISVRNENAIPPPAAVVPVEPPPDEEDDSIIEDDEEILRAKLLLEIAQKKKMTAAPLPALSTTPPPLAVSTTIAPPIVSTAPISTQSTTTSTTAKAPSAPKATLTFPFPLKGTGETITKTILNPRSKNRQIVRVVNNSSGVVTTTMGPNFNLRKTINNTGLSVRPNLHAIQRTVINTNLLKKNIYNQNADPLMRNVKITVPNKAPILPLIIPVGADSSTDEESSDSSPVKAKEPEKIPKSTATTAASKRNPTEKTLPAGFEDSLNSLLRSSREQAKPSAPSAPLPNLKHLPPEKQAEYLRLKSQIDLYERRIQKKEAKKDAEKVFQGRALRPEQPNNEGKPSQKSQTVSARRKSKETNNSGAICTTRQSVMSTQNSASGSMDHLPSEAIILTAAQNTKSPTAESVFAGASSDQAAVAPLNSVGTTASENQLEKAIEGSSLNGNSSSNADVTVPDLLEATSADEEDGVNLEMLEVNEAKLLASDEESDTAVVDASMSTPQTTNAADGSGITNNSGVSKEKPFVVDAAKAREELYLREKLLKAQLLKKMEASNDKIKLRKLERDLVSYRKNINRELTSLLSEMVALSDLKVKMKTQQEKVLLLREQLYAAEQQLGSTVNKIQTYEARRKSLTSRVINMRKECVDLVKECRTHGQKVQPNYQVPAVGAVEMKSKLVEVRNQNLVFRRENQKLKLSPRKQSLLRKPAIQTSATLAAANRVKRSFHLMGKRAPATPMAKRLPSTPQQLRYNARKLAFSRNFRKGIIQTPKNAGLLTRHGKETAEDWDDESVFLLPRMQFRDILTPEEPAPLPRGRIPMLPYSVYESPLSCIRDQSQSDSGSSTPGLVRNLDPFVTLCYFELRGMCNSVKCAFQHLYRPAAARSLPS